MRLDISFKNFKKSQIIENVIAKDVKKIERRLKMFKKEVPIHLSLHVEKNPHKEEYFSWANLYLPFRVLRAQARERNVVSTLNKTFSALITQIDKFKHRLERHLRKK